MRTPRGHHFHTKNVLFCACREHRPGRSHLRGRSFGGCLSRGGIRLGVLLILEQMCYFWQLWSLGGALVDGGTVAHGAHEEAAGTSREQPRPEQLAVFQRQGLRGRGRHRERVEERHRQPMDSTKICSQPSIWPPPRSHVRTDPSWDLLRLPLTLHLYVAVATARPLAQPKLLTGRSSETREALWNTQ